jgi:pimeloyl-ACP methyl ester carboxylesterase
MAYLHANGGFLYYRAQGEGTPVIALHGSASTGAQWRSLVGYLAGRFKVVTPDLPGYGRSQAGRLGGLAGDAAAVAALIDQIGAPAHLVGHSWGGAVALRLARVRPDAVRSLTMIEPVAFHLLRDGASGDRALFGEIAALERTVASRAEANAPVAAMRRFIDFWNGAGAWSRTSPRLQGFFLGCLGRIRAEFRAVLGESWQTSDLAGIEVPALAVMGLDSIAASMRATELVAEALPRAVLRMIPAAGHLAPLTDPHLVDPMIAAHLVAADRARRPAPAIAA